jgi:hypothetical protein
MVVREWHDSEFPDIFPYHYENFPKVFQRYVDRPLSYNVNSDGFRSNFEFHRRKEKEVDIFLGCSHTFGIGHYEEEVWTSIVSNYTGNTSVNLGMPSTGTGTHYYSLLQYIDHYKVRNVFMFAPIVPRYSYFDEYFTHRTFNPLWPEAWKMQQPFTEGYLQYVAIDDRSIYLNHLQFLHAIAYLAQSRGANLYYKHTFPTRTYRRYIEYDRDSPNGPKIMSIDGDFPYSDYTLPRDGAHMSVEDMNQIGTDMVHLLNTHEKGYIEPIPYIDKIFPKKNLQDPLQQW